jgi:hypothetical protein
MSTKEKRVAYFELKGGQHFEADLALLKEKSPDNEWCKKHVFNPEKAAPEILFALLDHASKDEIVANRRKVAKGPVVDLLAEKILELKSLIEKLEKAETTGEAHELKVACDGIISGTKELEEEFGSIVDGAFTVSIERIQKYDAQVLEAARQELLVADIDTLDVEEMLSLLSRLGILVADQEPETLRVALKMAFDTLSCSNTSNDEEKIDEGDGLKKTEVAADLDQENELVVENEELKEQLGQKEEEVADLELENEDLQEQKEELLEQNENLQAENETLAEELEAEKKNQPKELDPTQAEKSRKKTNSPKSTGKNLKKSKSSKPR